MSHANTDRLIAAPRRFGRVNWMGLWTLAARETRRFMNVWTQTVLAPLITAGLFLLIFSVAIGPARGQILGVPVTTFIAPGVLMMTVIQNAFANTSSSIVISKVQGNIVDTLMPPLSPAELVIGYLAGGVVRGLIVAVTIWALLQLFVPTGLAHPLLALIYVLAGATLMGAAGMIAGIWANKFDQMAAITNFIVTPLAFLSGTFYSIEALPASVRFFAAINPVYYLIDGFRFSVIGVSDNATLTGLPIVLVTAVLLSGAAWLMLKSGARLKS